MRGEARSATAFTTDALRTHTIGAKEASHIAESSEPIC